LLLRITFDKASFQNTQMLEGTLGGFVRHHTPPHKNSANQGRVLRRRPPVYCAQETGAALAGM
jgi:hypothetical protein